MITNELRREYTKRSLVRSLNAYGSQQQGAVTQQSEGHTTGIANGYLRLVLGDSFFTDVVSMTIHVESAADLGKLGYVPELKHLHIHGPGLNEDNLSKLKSLTKLESLGLEGLNLGQASIETLTSFEQLSSLRLRECELSEELLSALVRKNRLHTLSLDKCELSEEQLKLLASYPKLFKLGLARCQVNDSDLQLFHGSKSPRDLMLDSVGVTWSGIWRLHQANPYWTIQFQDETFRPTNNSSRENVLPAAEVLGRISNLAFQGALITDQTLADLATAPHAMSLSLINCQITDAGMDHLRAFKQLQGLTIQGSPITDRGLRALGELDKLTTLNLKDTKVTGQDLSTLPTSLTTVAIGDSPLTNHAVSQLKRLNNLAGLYLNNTPIDDGCVDQLIEMKSVVGLFVVGTAITPEGVSRIKRSLPNAEVFR